jgi:hypothetical protein
MVNLYVKSFAAIASLILVTGLGAFAPAQAKPDCDKTPDAPICNAEPKPKPKPKLTAQQPIVALGELCQFRKR